MIEYDWVKSNDGEIIAYVNDTVANRKMVVIGSNHKCVCNNFYVLLARNGMKEIASVRRYQPKPVPNARLLEIFNGRHHGGFLSKDFNLTNRRVCIKRIKLDATSKQEVKQEVNRVIEIPKETHKTVAQEYDDYFTRTENGVIKVYGVKLVHEYKPKTKVIEDIKKETAFDAMQMA